MRISAMVRHVAVLALVALGGCVVVDGPIDTGPQYCTREYEPVCARRGDDRQTFPNECEAERAGYFVIRDGQCRGDRPDRPEYDPRPPRPPQYDPRPPRPDRPQACPAIYAPVCARQGSDRRTFESACHAAASGYSVIRDGECGGGQMRPPGQPGGITGGPGSSVPGAVPGSSGPSACTREFAPVCGVVGGERQTFSNECMANEAGARRIRPGQC